MNALPHPARSPEFLSRLHDGDLTAAERVQFESHRAHCAECRNAAFEFEAALSLYRSSRPRSASPDLSSRILRKLQQSSRRRVPLGGSVALNLRWAGAFAAAIIAAIIGFSVVARQESRRLAAREVAVPVTIDGRLQANEPASNKLKEIAAAKPAAPPSVSQPQRQAALDKDEASSRIDNLRKGPRAAEEAGQVEAAPPAPAAPPALAAKAPANEPSVADKKALSASREAPSSNAHGDVGGRAEVRLSVQDGVSTAQTEKQGGEGSSVASAVEARDEETQPVRLIVTAADGGSVPEVIGEEKIVLPPGERGHEYLLVVDSQGHVNEVRNIDTARQKTALRKELGKPEADAAAAHPLPVLKDLRFRPADRPRLLRVKIE
jgi:hypothetical protein